jgi:hypothetical protein
MLKSSNTTNLSSVLRNSPEDHLTFLPTIIMARMYRKQPRAALHAGESDCKYTRLARRIGLVTLAFVLQLSSSTSSASSSSSVQAAAYRINVDDVHELLPTGVAPTAAGGRKALSLYYYNGRVRPGQNSWDDDVQQLQLVANTFALRHRHSYTQNGKQHSTYPGDNTQVLAN